MKGQRKLTRQRLSYERRIIMLGLWAGLPGATVALILLWHGDYTAKLQWTLTLFILLGWLGSVFVLRERVVITLQTIFNLLAALREGDYSIRVRGAQENGVFGEVVREINALGETLHQQRLGELEATALLRTVMREINVAVFAFDSEQRLRLVNRAGERLLAQPEERLLGHCAEELNLAECLQGDTLRTVQMSFPGGSGRWGLRRSTFREQGMPHQLLVVSDLSRTLREEERQAWQRLVRVLGHELNNSLAPIKSLAGSLENLLVRQQRPPDWQEDMQKGLSVIGSRAEALNRFMSAYARLAKLPQPHFQPVNVNVWVRRVIGLETRLVVELQPGPELIIRADADQLEQLLINIVRNAVDAAIETGGGVRVSWTKTIAYFELFVEDEGTGISNPANLFVPFFTTKPGGSGIGLLLSRQIAEAHGGGLTLENRKNGTGCLARLQLPL
ncbi:MAG: ATP-binding protein [Acidobacteriota bacterium]